MSKQTSTRPKADTGPPQERRKISNLWVIIGVVAVVVVIAAVVAIVATGDDTPKTAAGIEQTRPVTVSGTPLPTFESTTNDPAVGTTVPTLTGSSFDGTPITVQPGKPTMVVFLAHWCPHCQREVPVLTQWAADGGVPKGMDVIGVATSTSPDAPNYPPSDWLEREKFPFPVMADSSEYDAANAYGLSAFPYFVVFDSSGKVVSRATGEIDPASLDTMLKSVT